MRRHQMGAAIVFAIALVSSGSASGQGLLVQRRAENEEAASLRLRWGASFRSGVQEDLGPGLSYSGRTENDVALDASYFFTKLIGLGVGLQREGFGLYDVESHKVLSGGLLRAQVGPAVRGMFGRFRVEGLVGYQLAELPDFGDSIDPVFTKGQRHAVLLAARGLVDLGIAAVEVRGELPIPLSVGVPQGAGGKSSGYGVGASVRVPVLRSQMVEYAAVVDGALVNDTLSWVPDANRPDDRAHSDQKMIRAGLALQIRWPVEAPGSRPKIGALWLTVVDEATGAPVPGATVELEVGAEKRNLTPMADGRYGVGGLSPGVVVARAAAAGYFPGEAQGAVVADVEGAVRVTLKKEPPKVGGLTVTVLDKEANEPVAGAAIDVRGKKATTDAKGVAEIADLDPGLAPVKVTAVGFKPGQEVASVVLGTNSPVSVGLIKEAKRAMATITGRVRSTVGGTPVAATLELPQAKLRTRADASGSFTFKVEGGTYSVNISAPGYINQSKTVTVKDGDQAIFNVDLHPK